MNVRFLTDCVFLDLLVFPWSTLVFLFVHFLFYFSSYPKSWKGLCNLISQQANFHILYSLRHDPYFCCWSYVSTVQASDNLFLVNPTLNKIAHIPNGSCRPLWAPSTILFIITIRLRIYKHMLSVLVFGS